MFECRRSLMIGGGYRAIFVAEFTGESLLGAVEEFANGKGNGVFSFERRMLKDIDGVQSWSIAVRFVKSQNIVKSPPADIGIFVGMPPNLSREIDPRAVYGSDYVFVGNLPAAVANADTRLFAYADIVQWVEEVRDKLVEILGEKQRKNLVYPRAD